MVPKNDARTARQSFDSAPQIFALPFVGHQPEAGNVGVAAAHRAYYSGAMQIIDAPVSPLRAIRDKIAHAAHLAGREPGDIELIAISKTQPVEAIRPLIDAGQRVFGENRVQEAQAKWPVLSADGSIRLHLVGQLQSNKAAEAVALFDAIHSVDRPSLIDALARAMDAGERRPDCFVQVNIGDEPQKGGCAIAELPAILQRARDVKLPVVGLMAVPPAEVEAAPYFALLAKLARRYELAGLSIGMSHDFETAVMLGATHVRVGTALFGERTV
jgi:pyridoxal phosphate enzyme (YggS family)